MVKIGPLLTKLWPCKVNHHFVKHFSPLCTGFRTYVKTVCLLLLHINSRRFFVHKEKRTTLLLQRFVALYLTMCRVPAARNYSVMSSVPSFPQRTGFDQSKPP